MTSSGSGDRASISVDTYEGLKEGAKVSVKYTEKGGEKTAVAIKDASKATAKAVATVAWQAAVGRARGSICS